MLPQAILGRMDVALLNLVPAVSVVVHGGWISRKRRSDQIGVVDHVWEARLTSASAFPGMALLQTASRVYWAKAAHTSQEITARVSMHGKGEQEPERMSFAVGLDDAYLPSVPVVASGGNPSEYLVHAAVVSTGRVACIARCDGNAFFVLLFSGDSVKFGRNRLWRLRDSVASQLPPDLGELLTRRRAGVLEPGPPV